MTEFDQTAVMIDIETLATTPDAAIVSVAAVAFVPSGDGPLWLPTPFRYDVRFKDAGRFGTVDAETVEWWLQHGLYDPSLKRGWLMTGMDDLNRWLRAVAPATFWAKSPSFDLIILEHAYRQLGVKPLWTHRTARDVRTLTSLAGIESSKPAFPHDPLSDALAQIHDVQRALVTLRLCSPQAR